jgi:hypothetical protein
MPGLLAQLQALTEALRCVAGETLELYRLRVWLAARLILENPSLLPFDKGGFHGDLVAAAEQGEVLAAELLAMGINIAVVESPFYRTEETANAPAELIGPFWTKHQGLVRFDVLKTRVADWVSIARRTIAIGRTEPLFVLPAASSVSANGLAVDVPRGTVWISATLVVPGTQGFVGLRIKSARIVVDTPLPTSSTRGRWVVGRSASWTASLEPEQPAPGDVNGFGFDLPKRLEISHSGSVRLEGVVTLTDPEGAIVLSPAGTATKVAGGIRFPLDAQPNEFRMNALPPHPVRWRGRHRIGAAGWLLPFALEGKARGQARHGGLIELGLADGETNADVVGTTATLSWARFRLRLAASGFSCLVAAARGRGVAELSTWAGAASRFRIGSGPKVISLSWSRDGALSLLLGPGELSNEWSAPRAADSTPLQLPTPNVASLGLSRSADGKWLTTLSAMVPDAVAATLPLRGFALPNLYVPVHGPRRMAAGGRGRRFLTMDNGFAWLKLDARMAEPMLPDPYAASWSRNRSDARVESALDVLLDWDDVAEPAVRTQLASQLPWPEPQRIDPARETDTTADERFRRHLHLARDHAHQDLKMLDLSSNAQLFGIAIAREGLAEATLAADSQLTLPMASARLFLQPQVHWEPVRNLSPDPPDSTIRSKSQGMPGWAAASDSGPVTALPEHVATRIVEAPEAGMAAAVLFSLPFGLRAFAYFGTNDDRRKPAQAHVQFHVPHFAGKLAAATQIRLEALDRMIPGVQPTPDARMMAGTMTAVEPQAGDPPHVLAKDFRQAFSRFVDGVPVHRVDLSGYGLSCFSRWREDPDPSIDFIGITQVRFDVMIGRTSYQVIEMRSYLVSCQCRVVRTIILERANSGVVERIDSGWKAIEDGTFQRYQPFDTGLVRRFSNIRNIRILDRPPIWIGAWSWQAVSYDADAHLGEPGRETVVPIRGHAGYIPTAPVTTLADPPPPANGLTARELGNLFQRLGGPMGGPVDAHLSLAGTLPFRVTGIYADRAPVLGADPNFVVAVNGSPGLPRAGEWNCIRIGPNGEAAPVDPKRGVPVIRAPSGASSYRFRAAADAYRSSGDEFGFMMAVEGGRVLFPRPEVDPSAPGRVTTSPPELADAYALSQATGLLPARTRRLRCGQDSEFAVTGQNEWTLLTTDFTVQAPDTTLAGAAKWQLERALDVGNQRLKLVVDSAPDAVPWGIERTGKDVLELKLPDLPVPHILSLMGTFVARHGKRTENTQPDVIFGPALDELKSVLDALNKFSNLNLPFDIDVRAAPGPTPAFDVLFHLRLRIPGREHERIDIGVGKFMGQFDVDGQLRAALGGPASGQLRLAFEGDVQQGIIPPALYAGGHFRFAITVSDSADPVVELALATTASIGGDLIKGLIEVEVTVRYGYTLIPLTLEPGVLLGLEARAKLLSGLLGVSFGADAMARVKRLTVPPRDKANIVVFVELRVIATIEVLWGLADEEEELHTEFEQTIPLAPVAFVASGHPLLLAATVL